MRRAVTLAVLSLLIAAPAATAATASPAEIVGKLNAVRAQHGLPASLTENPDWTQSCRQHTDYMAANDILTHDEIPGRPGYTGGGAWAGQNAVLSQRSSWSRGTVFLNAPIHLAQILHPRLTSIGVFESSEFVCMTSWPGYVDAPAEPTDTLFSFPGNGQRFPHLQQAAERPWTPQSKVGIREGAVTGPYLYVWWEGPSDFDQLPELEHITGATLTGPDGAVDIRTIDREDVSGYIAKGSGWILPVKPLKPGGVYTASVTFASDPSGAGRSWTGSFSFTATAARLTAYTPVPAVEKVSAPRSVKRGTLLRRGVTSLLAFDGPGSVTGTLYAGRRVVGPARTARAVTSARLRLRAHRAFLPRRARKLTVRFSVTGADGGTPVIVTRRLSIRG